MLIIYDSQYWPPIGTGSDLEVTKYHWEQTQVLLRQKIRLLLLPHKRNNVTETNTKPLCAYQTMSRFGPPPGGNLNTGVY